MVKAKVSHEKLKSELYKMKMGMGNTATAKPISNRGLAAQYGVDEGTIRYWKKKVSDPNFHNKGWGGKRYSKYKEKTRRFAEYILINYANLFPCTSLSDFQTVLMACSVYYSISTIRRIFKAHGYKYKKPSYKHRLKFTKPNLRYYFQYTKAMCVLALQVPWDKIKYCDESHFQSRALFPNKAIGPIGRRICVINDPKDLNTSVSMTLLTNLHNSSSPIYYTLRAGSNDQHDFLEFVKGCVENQHLVQGDYFLVDNAGVHGGLDTFDELYDLLEQTGVRLIFLPKYSPELNPCEPIFAAIKARIRRTHIFRADIPFVSLICECAATITHDTVVNCYNHSIYHFKNELGREVDQMRPTIYQSTHQSTQTQ